MKSLYLQIFLQKFLYLLRRGGATALADAGLAAAAPVQGGVQGFGQGAHIAVPLGKAVAGAFFGGGQGGAQAGPDMGGQNGGAQTGPNGQQYYDADYKVVDDDDNNKK